jgi:hypothetical protein
LAIAAPPDALRTALLTCADYAIKSAVADYFLFVPIFEQIKPPAADVEICRWCSLVAAPKRYFTDTPDFQGGLMLMEALATAGRPQQEETLAA